MRETRAGLIALVLPLLLAGCEVGQEPNRPLPGAPLEAAIVPDANLVLQVDLQAVRQAPIFPALAAMAAHDDDDDDEAEDAADEAAAEDEDDDDDEGKEFGDELLAGSGLSPQDLIALVASVKIDPAILPGSDTPSFDPGAFMEGLARSPFALSLLFGQPIDLERVENGLRQASRDPKEAFEREKVGGHDALHIVSGNPEHPQGWVTILGENTLFLAFTKEGLAGAVQRDSSGDLAATDEALQQARAGLPEAGQGNLAFVVPETLRELIRQQLDKAAEEPAAAAMTGFLTPFKDLRSVGTGLEAADDLAIVTTYDLGNEAVASQTQVMFSTMLVPMAQAGLAEALRRKPVEVADRIQLSSAGSALRVQLRMTLEDLVTFQELRRKKKQAEEEAEAAARAEAEAEAESEAEADVESAAGEPEH